MATVLYVLAMDLRIDRIRHDSYGREAECKRKTKPKTRQREESKFPIDTAPSLYSENLREQAEGMKRGERKGVTPCTALIPANQHPSVLI